MVNLLLSLTGHDGPRVFAPQFVTLVDGPPGDPTSVRLEWNSEFVQFVNEVDLNQIHAQLKAESAVFMEQEVDIDSDDMPITCGYSY